ncbi:hypothetical protein J7F03_38300 [Streptomyces sp. ISL-43]|uniref:hypothetical protein n=1 Tax=Streptomyces sp. ISL-43 TaxID=2819183 RepID=UPI001BECC5C0|nr:hypothetical protein [Streptomyces sp. ISL-43]MBT2452785.1 hypothetical protein [Streptomyces sp. ISL-43]
MKDTRTAGPRRIAVRTLLWTLALITTVSGCGLSGGGPSLKDAADVKRVEMVGGWKDGSTGGVTLKEDGTFAAESLRADAVPGAGLTSPGKGLVAGSGEWELTNIGAESRVDLYFTGGGTVGIDVKYQDGLKVLSTWIGDGRHAVLKKEDTAPTP